VLLWLYAYRDKKVVGVFVPCVFQRRFTEVVPIKNLPGVSTGHITRTNKGSFVIRYLVAHSPAEAAPESEEHRPYERRNHAKTTPTAATATSYVMVDVLLIALSWLLVARAFMGPGSKLASILVTSRDAIHYDRSPSVFTILRSDIGLWKKPSRYGCVAIDSIFPEVVDR
jgi:hypothetical protein